MTLCDITNVENPFSLVNLVGQKLREHILSLPEDAFEQAERQLKKKAKPCGQDILIKLHFWVEYERCVRTGKGAINLPDVISGICHKNYFHAHFYKNPKKLAWLVSPPASYYKTLEGVLMQGLEFMQELMEMDVYDREYGVNKDGERFLKKKRWSVTKAKLKLDAYKDAVNRIKGMPVSRTVTQQQAIGPSAEFQDMESLDKKIKELEAKVKDDDQGAGQGPPAEA